MDERLEKVGGRVVHCGCRRWQHPWLNRHLPRTAWQPAHLIPHEAVIVKPLLDGGPDRQVNAELQLQRLAQHVSARVPERLHRTHTWVAFND
jgi:hypothetical protein